MSTCYPDPEEEKALIAGLDPGIQETVRILRENGVETYESCEGTPGHCFPEPTVCFHGSHAAGYHALSVALDFDLKPTNLRRVWSILELQPVGPHWEMTFSHPGGGLQYHELPDGTHTWVWGPGRLTDPEQRIAELENALREAR